MRRHEHILDPGTKPEDVRCHLCGRGMRMVRWPDSGPYEDKWQWRCECGHWYYDIPGFMGNPSHRGGSNYLRWGDEAAGYQTRRTGAMSCDEFQGDIAGGAPGWCSKCGVHRSMHNKCAYKECKGLDNQEINRNFRYHKPNPTARTHHEIIRSKFHDMAVDVMEHCLESRERDLAITKLEEALMWTNAAIARHEPRKLI